MTPSKSLDQLVKDMNDWRKNRKHQRDPIPAELIRRALKLTEHFKPSEIDRLTGIGSGQYKRLKAKDKPKSDEVTPEVHKYDLLTPNSFSVELGSGMRIDCQIGTHNFAAVITSLIHSLREGGHA